MDELDLVIEEGTRQLQAAKAELAALQATPAPESPSPLRQLGYDVGVGFAKAGAGFLDVLGAPITFAARQLGADPETTRYFPLTKEVTPATESLAAALGVQPDTKVQKAVEFMAPLPGVSKGRVLADVGLGALGFAGSELAGPIGGLAAPLAYLTGKKVVPAGARRLGTALSIPSAVEASAQREILEKVSPEGVSALQRALQEGQVTGTGGVPLTLAEIVQEPRVAAYQEGIAKLPGAENIMQTQSARRLEGIEEAITKLGGAEAGDFSLALQKEAAKQQAVKEAEQGNLLSLLGATEESLAKGKMAEGEQFRAVIAEELENAEEQVRSIWNKVDKKQPIDLSAPLTAFVDDLKQYGRLQRAAFPKQLKQIRSRALSILERQKEGKPATILDLQDLRSAAGRVMREASGKDPVAVKVAADFREALETQGIRYAEGEIAKGGLPFGAGIQTGKDALTRLSEGIAATRKMKQTFAEGAVGQVTKKRGLQYQTQASNLIDNIIKTPERSREIVSKFGDDSVQTTFLREGLLRRLAEANKPGAYLQKNKEAFANVFGSDLETVTAFAKSVESKAPLAQFANITESAIPNKVFANVKQASDYMNQFRGTELANYARAKFYTKNIAKGDSLSKLKANTKIAKALFEDEYPAFERLVEDIQRSKSPATLAAAAARGQSATAVFQTALGAIISDRPLLTLMKKGGGLLGGLGGIGLGIQSISDPTMAMLKATLGAAAGFTVSALGTASEKRLNEAIATLLTNPSSLKLAAAPPTPKGIERLVAFISRNNKMTQLLEQPSKLASELPTQMPTSAAEPAISEDDQIQQDLALLKQAKAELAALQQATPEATVTPTATQTPEATETPTPQPTIVANGQKYAIPTGEQYADPNLVKAIIQVESAGKPKAVSKKGATGLMQLMPATARDLGVNPKDPQQNIEGGSRYIKDELDRFGGIKLALAAYNWGRGYLQRKIIKVKADGITPTWENIVAHKSKEGNVPKETRDYVKKVLRIYNRLKGE